MTVCDTCTVYTIVGRELTLDQWIELQDTIEAYLDTTGLTSWSLRMEWGIPGETTTEIFLLMDDEWEGEFDDAIVDIIETQTGGLMVFVDTFEPDD
ncbi:uncharacterized protein EHS24_007494 [Apiotrichum porosum]|uniref:Uncharacterized protein n=1 Tax=Apiotrichum porosum TaxID=105984 RepID=A0A427XUH9_9TREE|nr:uncharacterized protein EHS24_007494 [Apiotrichum porosum]RSH82514.1 hypothetical protein EHS24_007494 [Apiotrichum porosum]